MKNLAKIIVVLLFYLSTSQAQIISAGQFIENVDSQIVKISVDELAAKMKEDTTFYLIDIRTEGEYLAGHIQESVWLPRGFLEFKIQKITDNPESEIILYCKGGGRSALAVYTLVQMGYKNVFNLEGGIREWVHAGNNVYNELGELNVIKFGKTE